MMLARSASAFFLSFITAKNLLMRLSSLTMAMKSSVTLPIASLPPRRSKSDFGGGGGVAEAVAIDVSVDVGIAVEVSVAVDVIVGVAVVVGIVLVFDWPSPPPPANEKAVPSTSVAAIRRLRFRRFMRSSG